MTYQGINSALFGFMQENENKIVTIDQLVEHFKGRFDRRQLMSNMANLLGANAGKQIEKLQIGMWRFNSGEKVGHESQPVQAKGQIFEQLRELNDGLLLIGEDGELYRAKKIKL